MSHFYYRAAGSEKRCGPLVCEEEEGEEKEEEEEEEALMGLRCGAAEFVY